MSGLRGTEAAPHYRGGGDIDLGCAPRDETAVVRAIEEKCLEHGVTIVSKHSASSMVQLQLYARSAKSEHHHLCVDIHTRETCFGVPFMDHADVASTPATHDAPDRIDPTQGALLDFLTPYLSGLSVHPEYLSRLKSAFERSPESLEALVTALVGTRCGERFTAALRADAPAEALAHVARGFRRALLRRATLRRPHRALFGALHCAWAARIRPLFCPRGTLVVLLGTDGTGKTTLAERMLTELRPSYRSAQNRIVKLRPGLLPQLGRFMGRRPSMSDYERPHRAAPSGWWMTAVRASYYWLDYVLGYGFCTLPLRRRNTLIVFDRWIDDWFVDPARYRMQANHPVVRLLARFTPAADVTLVTTAPLETVRARKQELEPEESGRQLAAYEALAAKRPDAFIVRTGDSIEEALDDALCALFLKEQQQPSEPLQSHKTKTERPSARSAA